MYFQIYLLKKLKYGIKIPQSNSSLQIEHFTFESLRMERISHLSNVNARKGYQQLSRLFLVHPSNETVRYLFCHTHPAALAAQRAISLLDNEPN